MRHLLHRLHMILWSGNCTESIVSSTYLPHTVTRQKLDDRNLMSCKLRRAGCEKRCPVLVQTPEATSWDFSMIKQVHAASHVRWKTRQAESLVSAQPCACSPVDFAGAFETNELSNALSGTALGILTSGPAGARWRAAAAAAAAGRTAGSVAAAGPPGCWARRAAQMPRRSVGTAAWRKQMLAHKPAE